MKMQRAKHVPWRDSLRLAMLANIGHTAPGQSHSYYGIWQASLSYSLPNHEL
jgi:hypothetical protein